MPLNLDGLYQRVEQMALALPQVESPQRLADAQAVLRQADPRALRQKLRQRKGGARIPWLVATPVDSLSGVFALPPVPADFSAAAADGSSIPPDRHSPVRYSVLNIGYAVLTYGSAPAASLHAEGRFCFADDELYFDPQGKRIPIEEGRLGILMSVEEMVGLCAATQGVRPPVVAVRDGTLILWNLQSEDAALKGQYLGRFLQALDRLRQAGTPVCSYISYPGGQDVLNSLRLLLCDVQGGGCARCPQENDGQRLCQFMGSLRDRQLFEGLLAPGQRSDLFESQSAILEEYKGHRIRFFYLNVGGEIARVEAPQWAIDDAAMLHLVHGVVYDQCRRSGQYPPYPAALIEAHEQAVISTADRETVERLVERALAEKGILYVRSAKDRSKRGRGV